MTDISKLADDILALINAKPRSPFKCELEELLREALADTTPTSYPLLWVKWLPDPPVTTVAPRTIPISQDAFVKALNAPRCPLCGDHHDAGLLC